ncbi:helix-turn-helix domain-containing protein [Palleronia sp. KMU-117]|uniref:helix-turn-helix domain-containing protein n=1 Tax=Palleronia sp. KMU-117 TaxID=3434108 RepID=UPI003D7660F3
MTNSVPLIRAAAVVPWVLWLREAGRPVQSRLDAADLGFLSVDHPNRVVPLLNGVEFIRQQSRLEGPDLALRVVAGTSLRDLANLGLVILNAETPRDSLERVARALPRHCTHEVIQIEETATGIRFRESWICRFDREALHIVQLYVAAIVASILRLTGAGDPVFQNLKLVPHPDAGLSHAAAWFRCPVQPSRHPHLEVEIAEAVAQAKFDPGRMDPELPSAPFADEWPKLRRSHLVSDSVTVLIETMLGNGSMDIGRVAASSGLSARTLQRQLSEEGTDFSTLLNGVRRSRALTLGAEGSLTIGEVAAALGYSNPPAFTRAFRRWTDRSPRDYWHQS